MAKKPERYKPDDWLKGSVKVGDKYTAWNTYGQGRPDFGKGSGPGEPYHEVQKTVRKPPRKPSPGNIASGIIRGTPEPPFDPLRPPTPKTTLPSNIARSAKRDPRIEAIRRRLGWT